jgi:sulfide:quinone oxidoreductase
MTKDVLPRMYFNKMLKGEWYGPKTVFPPQFVPS